MDTTSINPELMLFTPPLINKGVSHVSWTQSRSVNSISDGIEISLKASGLQYLDLGRCRLRAKFKILNTDGSPVDKAKKVAPVNLTLHSLFRQCDVYLQHQLVSTSGNLYPYKALLDVLTGFGREAQESHLQTSMFYKDDPGRFDWPFDPKGEKLLNRGWDSRFKLTNGSKTVELEGPIFADVFQFPRYLLNEVLVSLRLYQSEDSFRIQSADNKEKYKIQLEDVSVLGCYVTLDPQVVRAHSKSLESQDAIYPYFSTQMKSFAVPAGQYSVSLGDIYSGVVPSKVLVGMVLAESLSGDQTKNPYNFQNFNLSSAGMYINDQAVPQLPHSLDFSEGVYTSAYLSMFTAQNLEKNDCGLNVSLSDYAQGYCLLSFDTKPDVEQDEQSEPAYGNVRLELRFKTPLEKAINVILYSGVDTVLRIDQARAVKLAGQ